MMHAIVPHHHHPDHLCLANEHSVSYASHSEHQSLPSGCCSHQNEQSGTSTNLCLLGEYIPSQAVNTLRGCTCHDADHSHFDELNFIILTFLTSIDEPVTNKPDFSDSYLNFYTSPFFASTSLRGPPTV